MTSALIITDGRAGNLRQARALAQAMGMRAAEIETDLRAPWARLAPRLPHLAGLAQRSGMQLPDRPPWPRVVIGCGRQAAWATRWLRRRAGNATFCIQILDPRIDSRHWDILITPRHDARRGPNVIRITGSLNPINSAWLATARADFPELANLPRPRVALLLGGPRRGVHFDRHLREALIAGADAQRRTTGCVLLAAAPRTPPEFAQTLRRELAESIGQAWLGAADGPNPYPGHLAWADRIVVTPDSVNMLSEAAACGVPVHTLTDSGLPTRLAAFHRELRTGGWLHDLEDTDATPAAEPLRETRSAAGEALRRMQQHFQQHALVPR